MELFIVQESWMLGKATHLVYFHYLCKSNEVSPYFAPSKTAQTPLTLFFVPLSNLTVFLVLTFAYLLSDLEVVFRHCTQVKCSRFSLKTAKTSIYVLYFIVNLSNFQVVESIFQKYLL